ncbi:ATP-binding protein [Thermodesulfovibrio yellowstonii]|uniref:MinD superfamily P-loop ATPase containing an inserted ferredoxin domain n=1 Tax=Thermodesulfovibrio yellowstonii (strain ATCC 51303 / DSM 11347 / YP87) TaxID=289376 RepID=B5YHR1_THEYD|nr:ATP-binding protein [Thermodesulfovibrio yellowstonii]ACI20511.1 MinD superfamily P-loop ATPase containing an inserted ferredoxin domain [Thermodesulfovibrio yellowstonii DSM 11347]MDI6865713.1 ATP-binding protein [Thermodesulfovibrio yellowstonii]
MIISVASGKGGTGKTFFTGCLAVAVKNKVLVDCDVDAANLHLLLHPEIKESYEFIGGKLAQIDKTKCIECGLCRENCKFNAIGEDFQVDELSCEGCTICSYICPQEAIILRDRVSGQYFISETKYGTLIHARLGIAQENSGKLVTKLRKIAKETAEITGCQYIIIDGPPGVGCPVMASMTGVDLVVAVTEPTLSGMHDLGRVIELAKHFKIPLKVIINKFDLNPQMSENIEEELNKFEIELAGRIPFSEEILYSVKKGFPFLEFSQGKLSKEIESLIQNIFS